MFARIPLTNGGCAMVDPADLPTLSKYKWRQQFRPDRAVAAVVCRSLGRLILMHHLVLPVSGGELVDHRNGNPLDNRKDNLRRCTHAQNMRNRRKHSNNRSGYKGVYFEARRRHWIAKIVVDKRKRYLGSYDTPALAHKMYCLMAKELHGDFARLS